VPLDAAELAETLPYALETRHQHIEFVGDYTVGEDLSTFVLSCYQFHHIAIGQPFLELVFPVTEGYLGSDDDVWTLHFFVLPQESQNGDGLDGLTEAHVVSEDAVETALVETDHPVEPNQLVMFELPTAEDRRLVGQPGEDLAVVLLLLLLHQLPFFVFFFLEVSPSFLIFVVV
jgi:hypothetical protein